MKHWNWKLTRKLMWWTALVGFGFWLHPAHAQEFVTGKGIICDEAAQVARVITATDTDAMLVAVNGEKANACGILEIAYIRHGEVGDTVYVHDRAWQLTQILVIGIKMPDGWGRVEPMLQWTAFQVDERGA
jgi:hypothetical protein